jgi:hypothetical protein
MGLFIARSKTKKQGHLLFLCFHCIMPSDKIEKKRGDCAMNVSYFRVVFHDDISLNKKIGISAEFTQELLKHFLCYRGANDENDAWTYRMIGVRPGYSWVDGLWAAYVYIANTDLREVKEICFIDRTGEITPFHPCRPTAVS